MESIGSSAFEGCTGLSSVKIPADVMFDGFVFRGCTGLTSLEIPAGVKFDAGDFQKCTGLTSVTIHFGVKNINAGMFSDCTSLASVTIPSSVTRIGYTAFKGCTGLTSVTIPEGVESLGDSAFSGCTGLKSVIVPTSVTSVGSDAFGGCKGLASVAVPGRRCGIDFSTVTNLVITDGTAIIYDSAFKGCTGLVSVTVPTSVTSVGSDAFSGCKGLASVTVPGWRCGIDFSIVKNLAISEGTPSIANSAFKGSAGIVSLTIPDGVTSIGDEAFKGCTGLVSAKIPTSVTSIGSDVFSGCKGLTSVTVPGKNCGIDFSTVTNLAISEGTRSIADSAFKGGTNLVSVTIPSGVTRIGSNAFSDCTGLTSLTIPSSVTAVYSGAFSGYTGLTSVTVPGRNCGIVFSNVTNLVISDGTENICSNAFKGCTRLTSVTIPGSVMRIGDSAFEECTALTSFMIPSGVTVIGKSAFRACTALTSLTIPSSVASIGDHAFRDCTGLMSVTISEGVKSIGSYAFYYCTNIASLTIPSSVTSIGGNAFLVCRGLISVTISEGVTSIGGSAFEGCTGLRSVTIPSSVTNLGSCAFSKCEHLRSVTIPSSVTSVGEAAFTNCTRLASVMIAEGVTSIGDRAFYGCTALASVSIPSSVASIGGGAFYDCTALASVTIPSSVKSAGVDAFAGCTRLTSVTVPGWACGIDFSSVTNLVISDGTARIRSSAFRGCTGLKSVTIPSSVTCIDSDAFKGCTGLPSVTIPSSVSTVYSGAFSGCTGIRSAVVPGWKCTIDFSIVTNLVISDGTESIGNYVFEDCKMLQSLVIPSSVTSIGVGAFDGCTGLKTITFMGNAPEIGVDAFASCKANCTAYVRPDSTGWGVTIPGTWQGIGIEYSALPPDSGLQTETVNGVSWSFTVANGNACISAGSYSGDLSVPSTLGGYPVTVIGNAVFRDCTGLTRLVIPASVSKIGNNAFTGCSGLTNIVFEGNAPEIGDEAFSGCSEGCTLYVKCGSTGWGEEWNGLPIKYQQDSHHAVITKTARAATCTEVGWTEEVSCSRCGCVLTASQSIAALGHNSYVSKAAQAATCTDAGWTEEVSCSRCGRVLTSSRSIAALGHNPYVSKAAQAATYSAAGWTEERKCSRCGIVLQASVAIPKLTPEPDPKPEPDPEPVYAVTFHANGGTGGTTLTYRSGATLGTLPTATRNGYRFIGWYTAVNGGSEVTASTVVAGAETYYAHWSPISYTVTFDANGGVGLMTNVVYTYGIEQTLPSNQYVRTGWKFVGWSCGSSGSYADGARVKDLSDTDGAVVTLRAKWESLLYRVTFDLDEHGTWVGGGELIQSVYCGEAAVAPVVAAVKNYQFGGWDAAFDCVVSNMTIRAKYRSLMPYVGTAVEADCLDMGKVSGGNKSFKAGSKVTLKATPNRGFVVEGWYDEDGNRLTQEASCTVVVGYHDANYTARFIETMEDWASVDFAAAEEYTTGLTIDPITINAEGGSLPTVKVTGLPTGFKFTAKLVTTKKTTGTGKNRVTTVVTNALPNTICGTPTKSGVYTIVATATTSGKKTASCSQTVVVRKASEKVVKVDVVLIDAIGTIASTEAVPGKVTGMGVYAVGKKVTLKATAKTTSGSGKTKVTTVVTNVAANTIYGAPSAASKTTTDRKTGKTTVTPSQVKVTVTTAGKSSQTYQINTTVDPLPSWVVGTFAGPSYSDAIETIASTGAGDGAYTNGTVSVTIGANGKVSAKQPVNGKSTSFAASYFDSYVTDENAFYATLTAKVGKEVVTNEMAVGGGLIEAALPAGGTVTVTNGYIEADLFDAWQYNWKSEPWKAIGKSIDKRILTYAIKADGTISESDEDVALPLGADIAGRVTLKFATSGAVTVVGEFVTGYDAKKSKYVTVKATGSTVLVPDRENQGLVFVYLSPKGLLAHTRCLAIPWPND